MSKSSTPAYRPCVGIAVFNRAGLVFLGRRKIGPETGNLFQAWQMPQGGIDRGEAPYRAALRELYEETSIRSVTLLGEAKDWLCYDLPAPLAPFVLKGRYRGQNQKWFAFRFEGDDSEIDVKTPGGGKHKAEFRAWRWERLERVPELIVPFKRAVYDQVAAAFLPFARPVDAGEPTSTDRPG
ncbi:MAG: RNA pyrophosphohydrolase [Rhizobiales bacterium]|nr:RNA pyrophosphohydrolase [Hyphomicrobiales bacterium]MDQ3558840.1 RNA pyrophosphohydrolase [Pseudomonadota bacterium]